MWGERFFPRPEDASYNYLHGLDRPDRRAARIAYLAQNPEARIQLDFAKLRATLDYRMFLCHPNSSVAVDCAIVGSDIDLGIVVVTERDKPKELDFINELRRQGFKAHHFEVEATQEEDNYSEEQTFHEKPKRLSARTKRIVDRDVKFITVQQYQDHLKSDRLDHETLTCKYGFTLDMQPLV